jgi:hypothetical protein
MNFNREDEKLRNPQIPKQHSIVHWRCSNFKSVFLQRATSNKYLRRPTITIILRKFPSNSMPRKLYVQPYILEEEHNFNNGASARRTLCGRCCVSGKIS